MTEWMDYLQQIALQDWRGWTAFGLAVANMLVMYGLDAPRSTGGRISRTLMWLGMLAGLFSLGVAGYLVLLLAVLVLNIQYYRECVAKRKEVARPARESKVASIVTGIVRNYDERPASRHRQAS